MHSLSINLTIYPCIFVSRATLCLAGTNTKKKKFGKVLRPPGFLQLALFAPDSYIQMVLVYALWLLLIPGANEYG
jgi:hypothetical protein